MNGKDINNSNVSPGNFVNLWETLAVYEKNHKYPDIDGAVPVWIHGENDGADLAGKRNVHKSAISGRT